MAMELQKIEEKDEAGTILATYVPAPDGRIDIIVSMYLRPLQSPLRLMGKYFVFFRGQP